MSLRPDVIDNLRAVSEALGISERTFNMEYWGTRHYPTLAHYGEACGTTLCIGGHYGMLKGLEFYKINDGSQEFYDLFKQDFPEDYRAPLFHAGFWPEHLRRLYQTNPVAAGQSAIEWYIGLHAEKTQEEAECQREDDVTNG